MTDIYKLLEIMKMLRDPDSGCPWDLEQDFRSIYPYTIEEAYEVADAIDRANWPELRDELGDLLLQVVFHAQMASERGLFSFEDVVESISSKMIRRHPHVFGDAFAESAAAQSEAWADTKHREREKAGQTSVMDGVALALPALLRADKLSRRAARVGFDWPDAGSVRGKVDEELDELDQAISDDDPAGIREELGDLLTAIVTLARHLDVDPEDALRAGNAKFERRFRLLENYLGERNENWSDLTLEEMEARWQAIKKL